MVVKELKVSKRHLLAGDVIQGASIVIILVVNGFAPIILFTGQFALGNTHAGPGGHIVVRYSSLQHGVMPDTGALVRCAKDWTIQVK